LVETAKAAEFFLVDGVIVSGIATGHPADAAEVRSVARAVSVPTLVGSGVTANNVDDYLDADALIVGSSIKQGGVWSGPIDESRASELARAFNKRWWGRPAARLPTAAGLIVPDVYHSRARRRSAASARNAGGALVY